MGEMMTKMYLNAMNASVLTAEDSRESGENAELDRQANAGDQNAERYADALLLAKDCWKSGRAMDAMASLFEKGADTNLAWEVFMMVKPNDSKAAEQLNVAQFIEIIRIRVENEVLRMCQAEVQK